MMHMDPMARAEEMFLWYSNSVRLVDEETFKASSPCHVMMARLPEPKNMKHPRRFHIGYKMIIIRFTVSLGAFYLKYALLDVFSTINDIPNDDYNGDDEKGDEGAVAEVFSVNIWVIMGQLGCGG